MKFPLTIDSIHNNYEIFYKEKLFPTFDYTKLINIQEEIVKNYYNFVKSERDYQKKKLFLSGGMISLITSLPYIEKEYTLNSLRKNKVSFKNSNETCEYFLGKKNISQVSGIGKKRLFPKKIPKLNKYISIYRTFKYNKNPFSFFNNLSQSFTINPLIYNYLIKKKKNVKYVFPQAYLSNLDTNPKFENSSEITDLSKTFFSNVFSEYVSNELVQKLILEDIKQYFFYSKIQFDHLEKKSPPLEIFTGTGGMFTNRVIGLWIKNIGGRVVRFAHGTSSCFFYETDIPSSIIELFPSTDFIFPTKKFMNFVKKSRKWEGQNVECNFDHAYGQKEFIMKSNKNFRKKPKILYVGGLLRNNNQVLSPNVVDIIYFEWQFFLKKILNELKLECESIVHPVCSIPRHINPIHTVDPNLNFDDIFDSFDVIIFDHFKTTTFVKSLCSEKKIIFIDIGGNSMNKDFKRKIKDRCYFFSSFKDKYNRIRIEKEKIKEAIYSNKKFDRYFFKELYC